MFRFRTCQACLGTGLQINMISINCISCGGSGKMSPNTVCSNCNGSGKKKSYVHDACRTCKGSGRIPY